MLQTTVVNGGTGIPRAQAEKPGERGQDRAVNRARGSHFGAEAAGEKASRAGMEPAKRLAREWASDPNTKG